MIAGSVIAISQIALLVNAIITIGVQPVGTCEGCTSRICSGVYLCITKILHSISHGAMSFFYCQWRYCNYCYSLKAHCNEKYCGASIAINNKHNCIIAKMEYCKNLLQYIDNQYNSN